MPTFRRGAIKGRGRPKNIAALIGTNECRQTGELGLAAIEAWLNSQRNI
jgi:hypothetical protein